MVAELSRAGVVTRREDDDDRRRTLVGIADEYRDGMQDALARCVEPIRQALDELSAEQAQLLVGGIRSLVDAFESDAARCDCCQSG